LGEGFQHRAATAAPDPLDDPPVMYGSRPEPFPRLPMPDGVGMYRRRS